MEHKNEVASEEGDCEVAKVGEGDEPEIAEQGEMNN
jgi:hypothetical protein